MRQFAALFDAIDATSSTRQKIDAIRSYFECARAADAAWAVYFLSGQKLRRVVGPAELRRWLVDTCDLPEWLIDAAYAAVGDLAETISLLASRADAPTASHDFADASLSEWVEGRILKLSGLSAEARKVSVTSWWRSLPARECLLVNKLMTGALRVGVSRALLARALAERAQLPRELMLQRLAGEWIPSPGAYAALIDPTETADDASRPYPFYLASPLDVDASRLGPVSEFLVEWKWDGIRCQVLNRGGALHLWSRGDERITERFPEVAAIAATLPDGTVLDGELVAWADAGPAPFALLQQRIGRKRLSAAILAKIPVRLVVYDLLELAGIDLRAEPLSTRRARLSELVRSLDAIVMLSPEVTARSWPELAACREEARQRGVEGLMLKHRDSAYGVGRKRGAWWKWKVDPYTLDAVLLYAYPGHGRRSSLYTDYTFGVWRDDELVPVAKAYSGLDQSEIERLDRWIRRNTVERFGPVRAVRPELVFELAFEGIARSPRHKSGVALRFPRIARWREDKTARDAETLHGLTTLLEADRQ